MNPGGFYYASLLLFLLSWTRMVLGDLHHSDTEPPSPGVSGIYHDKNSKIIHVHYGSDDLHDHMVHLLENHQKYPQHRNKMYPVPKHPDPEQKNRKHAMKISNLEPEQGKVRDEKPPNFVTHDRKHVTVKHVPEAESHIEKQLLSHAARIARSKKTKKGTKVQFHANPASGWTPPASSSLAGPSTSAAGTSASAATLCAREVVELYRRALEDGDDEQLEYLSRRSCRLPRPKITPKRSAFKGLPGSSRSHRPASRPAGRSGLRPTSRRPAAHSAAHPAARHPASRRPVSRRPTTHSAAHPAARRPTTHSAARPASRPAKQSASRHPASRPATRRPAARRPLAAAHPAAHPAAQQIANPQLGF